MIEELFLPKSNNEKSKIKTNGSKYSCKINFG